MGSYRGPRNPVVALTSSDTLQEDDQGATYSNQGAPGPIVITLPAVLQEGAVFTFTVVDPKLFTVAANAGHTIRMGTQPLASISSSDVGTSVILTGLAGNIWNAVAAAGNWGVSALVPAFPVGSIFISAVATNPATLLGYGTWSPIGAGRVLVGLDPLDPSFDTLGETGGEKAHTLTIPEMPAHVHVQAFTTNPTVGSEGSMGSDGPSDEGFVGDTSSTGGGGPHNNLQPYLVCTFWQRTA